MRILKSKINSEKLLTSIFRLKGNLRSKRAADIQYNYITKYRGDTDSAVSLSADFELAWAFRGRPQDYREKKAANSRANFSLLLKLFEQYNIPVTWATVGHLFLNSCHHSGEMAHQDMPRPPINSKWDGDWYKHDPCSNLEEEPFWYAPDLIEKILLSKVQHEIGTHSFSHLDFSRDTSNRAIVKAEIIKCIEVMKPFGIKPRSLVFPFNHMGHQYNDILYDLGIIAVRHRDPKYRIADPVKDPSGLYRIYESMNLRSTQRYDYWIKAKIFIEHAIQNNTCYHIWYHPSDERKVFETELKNILKLISTYVAKRKIWATTMGELAAYVEAKNQLRVTENVDENMIRYTVKNHIDDKYGDPIVTFKFPISKNHKRILVKDNKNRIKELTSKKVIYVDEFMLLDCPSSTKEIALSQ